MPRIVDLPNVMAFLDMIAVSEGTSTSPATKDNGYDVIVTGADKKPEIFTDYRDHPFAAGREPKTINSKGLKSSASGRYQQMRKDWPHYKQLLLLKDFGPLSQDKLAIQHIRECRALQDVREGHLESAIKKCANIWASFPGAGYNQPEHSLSKLTKAYLQAGGKLA